MSQDVFGVVFIFTKGDEELARVPVMEGADFVEVSLPDFPSFECGINTEIIPGDASLGENWRKVELAFANKINLSTNKDSYIFAEPTLQIIDMDDSPEVRKEKFEANKKAQASALKGRVIILYPQLPRRVHPEGKTCGECLLFSRQRGQEELNAITHQYSNGSFAMTAEIIKAVCDSRHAMGLTTDIVGHCPKHLELCAVSSPACDQFEEVKP